MTPNEMLSDLQKLKLLPSQPLHWQIFSPTSLCVELDQKRYVYQLDLVRNVVTVYLASNDTEASEDFHFAKTIHLTAAQKQLLHPDTPLAS
ncbi:hypothetical protein RA086_11830 [Lactiplantibacillus sp. WILCCON 0030]|uniref:Uncharacterized protein n=1 Tax=Lactiplantibacillus brownii TaxID=3069269 RepID=A0ABU1AD45_9LACO|nr:hypothetical protein [Lactiplantibacillus brownii]MDQ7938298.1 hypothetical protein [Lactiplantibacillus brownii]